MKYYTYLPYFHECDGFIDLEDGLAEKEQKILYLCQ